MADTLRDFLQHPPRPCDVYADAFSGEVFLRIVEPDAERRSELFRLLLAFAEHNCPVQYAQMRASVKVG